MDGSIVMASIEPGFPAGITQHSSDVERLPFTIRAVTGAQDLAKAVSIRHRAYARHVPSLAETLRRPESNDLAPGCVVLLAESRLDGEPIGTLRIQTNRFRPLALEASAQLPAAFSGCALAEATRLGVALGRVGRVVKTMLFKAFYLYCIETQVEWMVIGARSPLDRMYQGLLFSDVFPGQDPVPLKHAGNLPHRILSFEIDSAEQRWRAARHPLYDLFVNTQHPDIQIGDALHMDLSGVGLEEPAALAA